jgi:hypothetical protein
MGSARLGGDALSARVELMGNRGCGRKMVCAARRGLRGRGGVRELQLRPGNLKRSVELGDVSTCLPPACRAASTRCWTEPEVLACKVAKQQGPPHRLGCADTKSGCCWPSQVRRGEADACRREKGRVGRLHWRVAARLTYWSVRKLQELGLGTRRAARARFTCRFIHQRRRST